MAKCTMTPRKAARMARIARGHGPFSAIARRDHWLATKKAEVEKRGGTWKDHHPDLTAKLMEKA